MTHARECMHLQNECPHQRFSAWVSPFEPPLCPELFHVLSLNPSRVPCPPRCRPALPSCCRCANAHTVCNYSTRGLAAWVQAKTARRAGQGCKGGKQRKGNQNEMKLGREGSEKGFVCSERGQPAAGEATCVGSRLGQGHEEAEGRAGWAAGGYGWHRQGERCQGQASQYE